MMMVYDVLHAIVELEKKLDIIMNGFTMATKSDIQKLIDKVQYDGV